MKDFKSSQLIELRKLSKQIYEAFDSALAYRATLLEKCSTSEYEHCLYDSLNDPETYYHFKLFDKAVSIVRLYNKSDWKDKEEADSFHFAVRCYGFDPCFHLFHKSSYENHTYGDFDTIEQCIKYFLTAIIILTDTKYSVMSPLVKDLYELEK